MTDASKSEAAKDLTDLFRKYKDFAFKCISQVPYGPVKGWISFADGDIGKPLDEDRGILRNLKEYYVISVLSLLAGLMAFWYIALPLIAVMGSAIAMLTVFGFALDGGTTLMSVLGIALVIILAIVAAFLILPAAFLLARGALFHILTKLAGGTGSYSRTLSILVLGSGATLALMVPMYLAYAFIFGWFISPLAYAVTLYVIYLEYRGFRHAHGLSAKRAAAVVIGGFIIQSAVMIMIAVGFQIFNVLIRILAMKGGS
jgi:hypothetical protein